MLARLGDVLYWAGCILAVLPIAGGVFFLITAPFGGGDLLAISVLSLTIGAMIWLIGRACRYALAGR